MGRLLGHYKSTDNISASYDEAKLTKIFNKVEINAQLQSLIKHCAQEVGLNVAQVFIYFEEYLSESFNRVHKLANETLSDV